MQSLIYVVWNTRTNRQAGTYSTWKTQEQEQERIESDIADGHGYFHDQRYQGPYSHEWGDPEDMLVIPLELCPKRQEKARLAYWRKPGVGFKRVAVVAHQWLQANKKDKPEEVTTQVMTPSEPRINYWEEPDYIPF